jgi:CPA1 family monovalent cation:H+ antiporter
MEGAAHVGEIVGITVGLLLIAAATLAVSKRIRIPFTVALVVVGMVIAQLPDFGGALFEPILHLEMPPEVAFLVFLPALIFESAFNLEARALRENLTPVLTLAIPGLLISTVMIGGLLVLTVGLSWPQALLVGSILSATDPVAVISLFSSLGAPKRLTVLVEGESLFNDATAIVLSKILLGVLIAGMVTTEAVTGGLIEFFVVFFGGLLVGWAAAVIVGMVLGKVEGDTFIEISLTTILAYVSFLLAEEVFHVSGVMAAVAAGVIIGGWGKTKISPSVAGFMEHFWEYLATVANALVFLMVGLTVDLGSLWEHREVVFWVITGMLISRSAVVFGLVPVVGKLPNSDPIDRRYQTVMFWGGLRGAVAIAIALSLSFEGISDPVLAEEMEAFKEMVVAVVLGAVLFTLIIQGLTIEMLVRRFGLHIPPLSDRLARIEGLLSAKNRTLEQIPELREGGLFTPRIAEGIRIRCEKGIAELRDELDALRELELDHSQERKLLFLRCFSEESSMYYQMFSRSHLSERAYRNLAHSIELQTEAIRHEGRLPEFTLHPPTGERLENVVYRSMDSLPGLHGLAEGLRSERTARDYEIAWARSRGSAFVLSELDSLALAESIREDTVEEIRASYEYWFQSARNRLDQSAEQFPEFVSGTQQRLADRLVVHAEREAIQERAHSGAIPEGVAEAMLHELAVELRQLRASQTARLKIEPEELLKKVPFFADTPPEEFVTVARKLRRRTAPAGEAIVRQDETGDSLFLVARGVVRVAREDGGVARDLATLMAGDFFGEMALLHGTPRTATCRAVTPCALYELKRSDLESVRAACPAIQEALEEADERRMAEIRLAMSDAKNGREEET